MQRHVSSLPIPNSYKAKLVKNGIEYVNALKNLKPTDLIKESGFTKAELIDLYETLDMFNTVKPVSAYDLLQINKQETTHNISTLSKNFDRILGGGIPIGKIVEICGAAGVGKTQISIQQCINIQIPKIIGGLESQAVYIDTEGSFMSNRAVEIAQATVNFLKNKHPEADLSKFTVENIMLNIFIYRCVDHVQLISIINNLQKLIEKHKKVKLVIVDSLAYPFRFVDHKDSNSTAMKTNVLNNFMANAYELITKYNLTFLITNQMTTRIIRDIDSNTTSSTLVPALGETWAHSANMRIILTWMNNKRTASVTKSSYMPDAIIYYKISEIGFEELEDDQKSRAENYYENNGFQTKKRRLDCD